MGQELRRANGQGFALEQAWDTVGQLIHQKSGDVAERAYEWSRAYEPMVITDQQWGQKRYDYDANGQIARTTHGDGKVEGFAYTPDLNISGTGDTDKFQNWQTTAAGVVKLARGPLGEVVTLEYDVCGRVTQRTITRNGFRPQTWTFSWNAHDKMTRATCPDGDTWHYAYDAFGRRISKRCKHTTVTFIWDGDVIAREITETRGDTRSVDWFFEPNSFRPMARLENGDLSHVLNDHLGTPKEVVGGDGALLWSADHDTWGTLRTKRAAVGAQEEAEDYWITLEYDEGAATKAYASNPEASFCPIRFQGQWEDAETGLYYNRFRYYDRTAGQYLCLDPIGLLGGVRASAYVWQPTLFIDPSGLASKRCCRAACRARDRARNDNLRRLPNYHGRLDPALERGIMSNPDGVYLAGNGNLIFHQGENIVVTHGPGSTAGQLLTSYGSGGPQGVSGASIFGGSPDLPGQPVTADMLANGGVPNTSGGFEPAAEFLDLDNC